MDCRGQSGTSVVIHSRDSARGLGDFPGAWPARPQWGDGIRIRIVGHYIIAYRVRGDEVQVLRILHGARDLDRVFADAPLPD